MRQLISETHRGHRGQLGVNVLEAGVVDGAFRNQWRWGRVVLGKCHLQLFERLNLNSGYFVPLINIVDSLWAGFRSVWKNNKHLNIGFNALLREVSGHSECVSVLVLRPPLVAQRDTERCIRVLHTIAEFWNPQNIKHEGKFHNLRFPLYIPAASSPSSLCLSTTG